MSCAFFHGGLQILIYWGGRVGAGGGHFYKSALLRERGLFLTKTASSFLLPFSHHASQIAFCSRSATRQCLPQANLQSRRSRGQDTSLALAASHTVGARARPLFFALRAKKFTLTSAKTFKKRGWAIHSEWNRVSGFDLLGSGILSLRLAGAIHLPRQREAFVMRDIASKNGAQERGAARQT